jgi:hypothetical protein
MISARYVGKTTEKEHFIFGKVYDIFGKSLGVFVHYKAPWWGYFQNEELNLSHLRPVTIVAVPIAQVRTRLCNYSKYEQTSMIQPLCSL